MSREKETARDDEELKGTFVMCRLFVFVFVFGNILFEAAREEASWDGRSEGG